MTTTVAENAASGRSGGGWLLWAGIAFVILAAIIVVRLFLPSRRRTDAEPAPIAAPEVIVPAAAPQPTPRALSSVVPEIELRPTRIGLNLVSVTVTGEITIRNPARVGLQDVRVRTSLLAAAAGHEDAVAALHRTPAGRLAAPPFALNPGDTRPIRIVAAAARSAIEPLSAAGRPMMVPLVAVSVDWRDETGEHRRTQAFAVGVERVDSPKLAPVWLDQEGRTFDAVAARPHGAAIG